MMELYNTAMVRENKATIQNIITPQQPIWNNVPLILRNGYKAIELVATS